MSNLRERYPHWKLACACTEPEAVTQSLGIEGFPIGMRDVKLWERRGSVLGRVKRAVGGVTQELKGGLLRTGRSRDDDGCLIPGTGLLTDANGLSDWGPYNLFKWSSMARLRGCNIRFLSVGVGPLYSRLGRRFVRFALASPITVVPGRPSMAWARHIGVRIDGDRIYPDLAFSLPPEGMPVTGPPGGRRVVGSA